MAVLAGRGRRTSRLGNDYKARDEEGGVSGSAQTRRDNVWQMGASHVM